MKSYLQYLVFFLLSLHANLLIAADGVQVGTTTLSEIAIYPQRSAPASVVSLNVTSVAAEIPAKIESIAVRVGDIVEKDQLLVKLKCTDYELKQVQARARLESLDARIEFAKRRLDRTRKLTMKQSVSEELLDERESDLTVLKADRVATKASLRLSAVHVGNCVITSPFRALLTERSSAVGNYAEVGKPLVQILDIDQLEVSAQVNAQDVNQISLADDLRFEHDDRTYPLNLRSILPNINSKTRNQEIRLLFQNGPALPGAAGKLIWRDKHPHIPGKLIVRRDNKLGVFVYENGKARFNHLPAAQAGRASEVDMKPSSIIITEGYYSLNDNDAVVMH